LTPAEFRDARKALGLTQDGMAAALDLVGVNRSDTIRSWEKGRRPISGPAATAVRYMLKFGLLP
jgi:DNA-binding transcriptional regulator YiaG